MVNQLVWTDTPKREEEERERKKEGQERDLEKERRIKKTEMIEKEIRFVDLLGLRLNL